MTQKTNIQEINDEISDLESRLQNAKARLATEAAPNEEEASWLHAPNGVTITFPRHLVHGC